MLRRSTRPASAVFELALAHHVSRLSALPGVAYSLVVSFSLQTKFDDQPFKIAGRDFARYTRNERFEERDAIRDSHRAGRVDQGSESCVIQTVGLGTCRHVIFGCTCDPVFRTRPGQELLSVAYLGRTVPLHPYCAPIRHMEESAPEGPPLD